VRTLCILLLIFLALSTTARAASDEVRVLIDVSGSMNQTDPNNLRVPALKLLLELLPPESLAGVWLFSENVESLVPPAQVNRKWKHDATQAAERIHSNGQFTDIEKVLLTAIQGWKKSDSDHSRHLILLTDGRVDIKGDSIVDKASRTRIIKELIPRLQSLGVHVYTIALSEQADHPLLKQLAVATDGRNVVALSADQLQRTFLNIFKSALPRDSVPLADNRFTIDPSIEEFSLLVFRKPASPATELIKPSGEHWTYDQYPPQVRWHHEESYDLITVTDPMPGEWRLKADVDPDNQVMIVTDLKLKVSPLPNYLIEGEKVSLEAELTEHGKRITRENFLRLVELTLQPDGDSGAGIPLSSSPDAPGIYARTLEPYSAPGAHTVTIKAESKTFQRSWEQNIELITTPVKVETDYPEEKPGTVTLRLIPDNRIVDPETFEAKAILSVDGKNIEATFTPADQESWEAQLEIPAASDPAPILNFEVLAKDHEGTPLTVVLKPITLQPPSSETDEDAVIEEDEELLLEEEEEEPQANWLITGLIAAAINLLLGVAGFFTWRWLKKRAQRQTEALLGRLTGELKESAT